MIDTIGALGEAYRGRVEENGRSTFYMRHDVSRVDGHDIPIVGIGRRLPCRFAQSVDSRRAGISYFRVVANGPDILGAEERQ